ncbi:FecCD family ABC transporter permease [Actinokineospora iranica]|nr:iron chelate uptake ABC transporter family permease subunit [Actinokineospora iranica]
MAFGLAGAALVASLVFGDYPIPLSDVGSVLTGGSGSTRRTAHVVLNLRLPRAVGAVALGASFGLSGAIFQRLAGNPLVSPDIVGVDAGAATVAVLLIVVFAADPPTVAVGALLGALAAAAAVYVLAYRRGVTGYRLVLVGIGVTAVLSSVTAYLLTTADLYTGRAATMWLSGSLSGRSWPHIVPVLIALAVLAPLVFRLAHPLRALELGDDLARSLGTRVEFARAGLVAVGAALAAVATAAAGPIAFVALAAPQIAGRLVRGQALVASAACGGALLAVADLAARVVLAPVEVPVGVLTAVCGGPFLAYLLVRANRA